MDLTRRDVLRLTALGAGLSGLGASGGPPSSEGRPATDTALVTRVRYRADHPSQFADLRRPPGPGPHLVVVVIHGGFWLSAYDLELMTPLCEAFAAVGIATWNIEYRRLGQDGGGWPGTFLDVAAAADHLRSVAATHALDLGRAVALGHSAGGHLALWLAARPRIREGELRASDPLRLARAVALAGIADLRRASEMGYAVVERLLGGPANERPERYAAASPAELLPLGVPQALVHGTEDRIVPFAMSEAYAQAARARGDEASLVPVPGAGHFEPIDPRSRAWPLVLEAVRGTPQV